MEKLLKNPTSVFNDRLLEEIEVLAVYPKGNSEIMYNKILAKFI